MLNMLRRLWRQLAARRRVQLGGLLVVMLAASVAELFSIGMVIPFLGVLTTPEAVYQHRFVKPLIETFGLANRQDLQLAIFLMFVLAVVAAACIRFLLIWLQARLTLNIINELATNAYRKVLHQPYSEHVARNSSEVIAGILSKISGGVGGLINAALTFVGSQLILIAIVAALIFYDPVFALSSFAVFGAVYALVVMTTKRQLARDSDRINVEAGRVVRVLQEGLGGIRDVLLDGHQAVHSNLFKQTDFKLRKAQANVTVISAGPRFVIEAIGIVAIAVIAYALSTRPGGVIAAIPIMGALAVGAQRMLPLLQQAYSSWALMMGNRDSLGDALKLLELPEPDEKAAADEVKRIPFDSEIRLENVSFHYQPEGPAVLEQLDLRIPKGARIGFIGETGSGKSTLIDVLIGLLSPSGGRMTVDGRTIDLSNHKAWQKHIAHVPQTIFLSDASIAENIAMGAPGGEIKMERVRLVARQARIADTIEAWPDGYETSVGERGVKLSGGQRQRIGIARALYKQADVIIFDEATSALDSDTERAVMQAIDELGSELTILIVAHRLTTLKGCSQIYELQAGRLKPVGTYADLVEETAV